MPKQTPLYAFHRQLKAKMADFAGWEMPISYGSELEEHRAVRQDAGMFDVSHMLAIDFSGTGPRETLTRVLANDIGKLTAPGKAFYSCMLNPEGGIVDDLIAYWLGDHRFRLVVNAGTAEKDLDWLHAHSAKDTQIEPKRDSALIAVQGPKAIEKFNRAFPQADLSGLQSFSACIAGNQFISRTGYTGEDGLEIILPSEDAPQLWQSLLAAGVRPAGLAARDILRLEAGMLLYGQDMDETTTPIECGLTWTVNLHRDFIGSEALRKSKPAYRLRGLLLEDKGVLRHGQKVIACEGEGVITSGGYSPWLSRSIALARLPITSSGRVEVAVRDRMLAARIVSPPFVRSGKALVNKGT
jgi:aminomethyltransferase